MNLRFNTDHYFHIGHAHSNGGLPCQDYALSDTYASFGKDYAFAMVSDGCSTGGLTDVGARVLTHTTHKIVRGISNDTLCECSARITHLDMQNSTQSMGLQQQDMLATSLWCRVGAHGGGISLQGDGVIALKYADSSMHMLKYEWADNTPYYLAYGYYAPDMEVYSGPNIRQFVDQHGGLQGRRFTRTHDFFYAGDCQYSLPIDLPVEYAVDYDSNEHSIRFYENDPKPLEYIAVMSDGVTQIDNIPWTDAVQQLLSFKTTAGKFVKRRTAAAIREWQKVGRGPMDDLSIAVIHVERTAE